MDERKARAELRAAALVYAEAVATNKRGDKAIAFAEIALCAAAANYADSRDENPDPPGNRG